MKILEDKEKIVRLFIDNLICGTIKISHYPKISGEDRHENYLYVLNTKIREFQNKPTTENINFIYGAISRLRVFGILQGEFINTEYEKRIYNLKLQLKEQIDKYNELLIAYKKSKSENIQLAEELKDRENIIETFEGQYYRKDENEE